MNLLLLLLRLAILLQGVTMWRTLLQTATSIAVFLLFFSHFHKSEWKLDDIVLFFFTLLMFSLFLSLSEIYIPAKVDRGEFICKYRSAPSGQMPQFSFKYFSQISQQITAMAKYSNISSRLPCIFRFSKSWWKQGGDIGGKECFGICIKFRPFAILHSNETCNCAWVDIEYKIHKK